MGKWTKMEELKWQSSGQFFGNVNLTVSYRGRLMDL